MSAYIVAAEGSWKPKRFVILEFPTMEQLRKFYDRPST